MKYITLSIFAGIFISCSPVLKVIMNVREPQLYATRKESSDKIHADLATYSIQFIEVFRSKGYLAATNDSSIYDQNFMLFNKDGYACDLDDPKYNLCANVSYRVVTKYKTPLHSIPVDSNRNISNVLMYLDDINGNPISFDQLGQHNYYIVMDWTTFTRGPQKRLLTKIKESIGDEDVLFIIRNKDVVKSDAIYEQLYAKRLK